MSVGTVPDATCPEDGVLVRVTACGICGTDVRTFYNGDRRITPPWVLGHEISGELVEIGPRAEAEITEMGLAAEDLVHCISTLWCGRCRLCRSGNEHLCPNGGLMGFDYQGAYAELVAIPQVALKNLFRIPEGLSDVHAITRTSRWASTTPSRWSAPVPSAPPMPPSPGSRAPATCS
jgi:threonine dehydrogenase-like Zn-dependent dehydrogenase